MTEKDIRKLIRESLSQLYESRMVTYTSELVSKMMRGVPGVKILDIRSTSDGIAGLFRYEKDGNAYEVKITPASNIKNKELWGKRLTPKEHPSKPMYRELGINKKT